MQSIDDEDEAPELPLIIELPKALLVQGLEAEVDSDIDPDSVAFDTAGFAWQDGAICLDFTFTDKGGVRLGSVYIDPVLSTNHSISLAIQLEVGDYVKSWSFASNLDTEKSRLREMFPRVYELCRDNEEALFELAQAAARIDLVEEEVAHLRQEHLPS